MKLTKAQIKLIILEELQRIQNENDSSVLDEGIIDKIKNAIIPIAAAATMLASPEAKAKDLRAFDVGRETPMVVDFDKLAGATPEFIRSKLQDSVGSVEAKKPASARKDILVKYLGQATPEQVKSHEKIAQQVAAEKEAAKTTLIPMPTEDDPSGDRVFKVKAPDKKKATTLAWEEFTKTNPSGNYSGPLAQALPGEPGVWKITIMKHNLKESKVSKTDIRRAILEVLSEV